MVSALYPLIPSIIFLRLLNDDVSTSEVVLRRTRREFDRELSVGKDMEGGDSG
jgi:hypothetical protein